MRRQATTKAEEKYINKMEGLGRAVSDLFEDEGTGQEAGWIILVAPVGKDAPRVSCLSNLGRSTALHLIGDLLDGIKENAIEWGFGE